MGRKVAFDIDDTIADCFTPSLALFNQKYGRDITFTDVANLCNYALIDVRKDFFSQVFGTTSEEVTRVYCTDSLFVYPYMEVFPKALEAINQHIKAGDEVIFITARMAFWRYVTKKWFRENDIPDLPVYYHHDKAMYAQKLGVQLFYEDNINNLIALKKAGVECNMISSIQNWSHDVKGVPRLFWNEKHDPYRNVTPNIPVWDFLQSV